MTRANRVPRSPSRRKTSALAAVNPAGPQVAPSPYAAVDGLCRLAVDARGGRVDTPAVIGAVSRVVQFMSPAAVAMMLDLVTDAISDGLPEPGDGVDLEAEAEFERERQRMLRAAQGLPPVRPRRRREVDS